MNTNRYRLRFSVLLLFVTVLLCACQAQEDKKELAGFSCTGKQKLNYATQFSLEEYGEYDMITVVDGGRFLVVPKDKEIPKNLPKDVTVLKKPLNRTYLVSTSAMDLIQAASAIASIRLSGTKQDAWYIEEAKKAMEEGKIIYAGKYNAPDYEQILKEECNLAIENTMIYHNPEVKEKLESLGIPVFVERSSYEKHPLGRLEWIKVYGLLFDKEQEAADFFEKEMAKIEPVMKKENTKKSVACFYVTSNGIVNVRKPNDYIAKAIALAGGKYVPSTIESEEKNALSTMNMQMEDFYAAAKSADILLYNSTIGGEINNKKELLQKNPLFSDFLAVKNNKVYCITGDFFQKSTGIGDFMVDLGNVVRDSDKESKYIKKLR